MLRRINSWLEFHLVQRRVCSLMRKAIGFAIVVSGFAVFMDYLVRGVAGILR